MSFESALLIAVSTLAGVTSVLATVIAILWRKDTGTTSSTIAYLKSELAVAIERIRKLEDGRLSDSVVYAHDIKSLLERLMESQNRSAVVHTRVCDAVNRLIESMGDRPCLRELAHSASVQPPTAPLEHKSARSYMDHG